MLYALNKYGLLANTPGNREPHNMTTGRKLAR